MAYLGDFKEDYATLNTKFTTRNTSAVPTTLAGTPAVSVYKANGTTESIAGITLTVDFDSRTGLNNVLIDLSSDAFYATGNDYQVVITVGTVGGVSVVSEVVAEFSIENRFDEVDVTQLGGSTQSATDLKDFADDGYDPATNKVQGVVLVDTNSDMRGTDSAFLASADGSTLTAIDLPDQTMDITGDITGNLSGNVVGSVASVTAEVGITQGGADKVWLTISRTLTDGFVKNVAFADFPVEMVLTSDHVTPATGLTVTGQRSIDGGAYANITGTITEVSNGTYSVDLSAVDTNGDVIAYRFSAATADDTKISIITQ